MKVHCSTDGCDGMANRLNGRCGPCKTPLATRPTPEVKAVAARRKVDPVPVLMPGPVEVDLAPAPAGHRCGSCGLVFPLLVDDVLCIRCDSLHYPAAVAS